MSPGIPSGTDERSASPPAQRHQHSSQQHRETSPEETKAQQGEQHAQWQKRFKSSGVHPGR
eukprot:10534243-Alexandrium_andersonii.AAC.1